ncbi:diacylglycerol/lipid kinase family protein [Microbacterium sp. ASV81]|uniref:YegS/Rv2252/BmrU family lipid kinase n=1 Tax=Microbacterium capsulatum TaxID=3041921 RepID=A0ABU0XDN3_9MICO|nr:YegS/Rv2252/BmrU family lipid kinase [Microbacterium sp. ASV81]MDQ4212718.1 YegS/Rv2252/BmrU family lipid kinase [Microbacterium sp. ASV81]
MTEPVPRIAVIANPRSGKGRGARIAEAAIAHLRERGAEVLAFAGDTAGDTRRLARDAIATEPGALVVVGGDGTLSGIVDLLADAAVPLVLVPAGTGNDLARALGIPVHAPDAAAEAALTGSARTIDLGEIESDGRTTPFLTVAALGFDARVSERTNRLRFPRGKARYYLALLVELVRLRPTPFRIRVADEVESARPGTLVAVGNTSSYGGGMPVCAGADPADGLLDVVHVAPLGRLRLIRLFPLLLRGEHLRRAEVVHRRIDRVEIAAPDLVVYADGERVAAGACTIRVRPAALTLLVPEERNSP